MSAPSHRRLALILGALAGIGPFSIDMYLPALPDIGASLAAPAGQVQGTLAIYFLGLAFGQVLYGPLSDRHGRRRPLFVGLGLYTVAAVACALAPDIQALTAARLFQAWLHTRETQQFFTDFTAQYSAHAQVQSKPGRRKITDIKLMKEDAAGVEAQAEEIKTRYARLFRV